MAAGRRDFQRALGALLSLDVAQVELRLAELMHFRLRARQHLRALEVIGDLDQRFRRDDLDVGTGPCCFRTAGGGADQSFIARVLAPIAAGNTPATGAIDPSSPSSRSTVKPLSASGGIAPIAAISPSAIGRS